MKNIKKFEYFEFDEEDEFILDLMNLFQEIIEKAFDDVGYGVDDIDYNELEINVIPLSNDMNGGWSKNFCNNIQKIADKIHASDFDFTSTFGINFYFNEDELRMLIDSKNFNL